jgi:enoyl-[acyl-carrier protein] reductase III
VRSDDEVARRVLIVGASRGIGRATALELAQRRCELAIAFSSNQEAAEKVASELPRDCVSVLIQGDIAVDGRSMVARAVAGLGGLDAVVVTAVPMITGPIDKVTPSDAQRALDVTVHGFRELALAASPHLAARRGSVVAVSSLGSDRTVEFYGALGPAKAALEATVRYLAVTLGRDHIRVNAVAPGMVDDAAHIEDAPRIAAVVPATAKRTPLGRALPTPPDIAKTIAALLGEDFAFVTGQTIKIDGGYCLPL